MRPPHTRGGFAESILKPIRILIDAMPRLLRDIVEGAVNLERDMQLIEAPGDGDLAAAVRQSAADVVIVADEKEAHESSHEALLLCNPHVKVLVVTGGGRGGHLLEFRRMPVTHMSPRGLVDAIRAAVA
jgi:hypothetical protein